MEDKKNKIKLVYDATIIANGVNNTAGRSGLYFVAINTLKELVKNQDINISLYCDATSYYDVKKVLEKEFKGKEFNIINLPISSFYGLLKEQKDKQKDSLGPVKKTFMQIKLIIFSLLSKIEKKFYKNRLTFKNYDAYLSSVFKIPETVLCKKYIILYDLIPKLLPQYNISFQKGTWIYDLCESLNSKDNYFAISEYTRKDFLDNYPIIDPNKITATLLACNERFKQKDNTEIAKIKSKYNIPLDKKYIFSLCTLEPRKNLIRTVKTFIEFIKKDNIDDLVFVLGGGHWEKFINILEQEIQHYGNYQNKILKIGYVEDDDLAALYSGAEWFTYTSQYEGFGLPPLEAMSCGCPVITSNNTSLPEVVGDAGIMIDYDDDNQHIEAYEKYYYNKDLRQEMAQKGLMRSKLFSWEKCVNQMVEVMKNNTINN